MSTPYKPASVVAALACNQKMDQKLKAEYLKDVNRSLSNANNAFSMENPPSFNSKPYQDFVHAQKTRKFAPGSEASACIVADRLSISASAKWGAKQPINLGVPSVSSKPKANAWSHLPGFSTTPSSMSLKMPRMN